MDIYTLSRTWFNFSFENPEKISPNHSALYFFAIEHCNRLGGKEKFGFPTEMAKDAIGIKSYNTYIKTLNDLVEWGFIKMIERSKNQYSANIIALSKFNKALDKALDKAMIKHKGKQSESTGQSIDSIDIQVYKDTNLQDISKDIETSVSEIKEISIISEDQKYTEKKEVYGNEEINDIIKAIKEKHGIVDGPIQEQRNFGNLLVKKIKTIEGFNGDFYNFIKTIIEQSDSYRIGKTTSPKKIYYNLSELIANIRGNIEKNKSKMIVDHPASYFN